MTATATAPALEWERRGREMWTAGANGRFEVVYSAATGTHVALDYDCGRIERFERFIEAARWCEEQAAV